jgi:hypothetical protein
VWHLLPGGAHRSAPEQRLAAQLTAAVPDVPAMAWAARVFTTRAVECLVAAGISQFPDLGCAVLGAESVHHVLRYSAPDARVVQETVTRAWSSTPYTSTPSPA